MNYNTFGRNAWSEWAICPSGRVLTFRPPSLHVQSCSGSVCVYVKSYFTVAWLKVLYYDL